MSRTSLDPLGSMNLCRDVKGALADFYTKPGKDERSCKTAAVKEVGSDLF